MATHDNGTSTVDADASSTDDTAPMTDDTRTESMTDDTRTEPVTDGGVEQNEEIVHELRETRYILTDIKDLLLAQGGADDGDN